MKPYISVTIHALPVPKARARVTRRGIYTPQRSRQYEALVADEASLAMFGKDTLTGPVEVHVRLYLPMPRSWSQRKRERTHGTMHTVKPDLDNFLKSLFDAMNGKVFKDDNQVAVIHALKYWEWESETRAEVDVFDLTGKTMQEVLK